MQIWLEILDQKNAPETAQSARIAQKYLKSSNVNEKS